MTVIIKPVITEKTMRLIPENQYTFEIAPDANKLSVVKEIKNTFKVDPVAVKIINSKGKVKHFRRIEGKRSDVKKAIVTLKKGQKLAGFETGK